MRTMKKVAMLALGFTLVGGALAHTDSKSVEGDFAQIPPVDKFQVACGGETEICASIVDDGPFNNNIFGAHIKCTVPKQSPIYNAVAPAGGEAEACVSNCAKAKVFLRCENEKKVDKKKIVSPCDDDYFAVFDCAGETITVEQTGNGNE